MAKTATANANKSEFIRKLPNNLPAAEVVKRAKAAGLTITAGLVYAVRSNERHKPSGAAKAKAAGPAARAPRGGQEGQFIALVLDLGLARSEELLASLRARLQNF